MQLVGARDAFIRRPFLVEGAITGAMGGLLAAGLTYATFRVIFHYVFSISWVPPEWAAGCVLIGVVFGVIASRFAVRKHLREI